MRSRQFFSILMAAMILLGAACAAAGAQQRAPDAAIAGGSPSSGGPLGQYVGQYRATGNSDQLNAVYLEGGVLYEESERAPRQKLIPDAAAGQVADRFRMELTPAHVVFLRDASGQIDVQGTMQAITAVVEGWIREYPDQWLWLHRRWR